MREEGRPLDVYAWSWPARSDDPYLWRGPAAAQLNAVAEAPAEVVAEPDAPPAPSAGEVYAIEAPPVAVAAEASAASNEPPMDAWVELPAEEEKPKRVRRPRGRKAEAAAEVSVEQPEVVETPEPAIEMGAPEPATAVQPVSEPVAEAPQSEPVAEAPETEVVPAPVSRPQLVVAVSEPAPPAAPDPAEILAPPAAPKRGWWRRG